MKTQMKFQKAIIFTTVFAAALCFIFSLGFSSDLYNLYYYSDPTGFQYVEGSRLYYDIQPFNHMLLRYSLVLLLIAVSQFVTISYTRRKYYLSNYITGVAYSAFGVYFAIYMLKNALYYRELFLTTIDFETYKVMAELFRHYSDSTFFFDAGVVISILLLLVCGGVLFNLAWKYLLMKAERSRYEEAQRGADAL